MFIAVLCCGVALMRYMMHYVAFVNTMTTMNYDSMIHFFIDSLNRQTYPAVCLQSANFTDLLFSI